MSGGENWMKLRFEGCIWSVLSFWGFLDCVGLIVFWNVLVVLVNRFLMDCGCLWKYWWLKGDWGRRMG